MIPDWQLPAGVDRGLWEYLHAGDMVAGYDAAMRESPLAAADAEFCERSFPVPGRLLDLGCGTGRLCRRLASKGHQYTGVDLSDEMLAEAQRRAAGVSPPVELSEAHTNPPGDSRPSFAYVKGNLVDPNLLEGQTFDYAACLFSTLGMIRGAENRAQVVANAYRLLRPGGRFVLHAHNRSFRGLGWKRVLGHRLKSILGQPDAGDITMPQPYGGAPLTLHHFTRHEMEELLEKTGFEVKEVLAIGDNGTPATGSRVYGWLVLAAARE